jgi:hypothetical protein
MITGEPPVGTYPGVPVEVNQPRHDEAFRGPQRVVHRPIVGLAHKDNTVILPDYHTIPDEYVGVSIKTDDSATLELRTHILPPPFYCPVRFMLSWECKVGNVREVLAPGGENSYPCHLYGRGAVGAAETGWAAAEAMMQERYEKV